MVLLAFRGTKWADDMNVNYPIPCRSKTVGLNIKSDYHRQKVVNISVLVGGEADVVVCANKNEADEKW